jgi:hypothetical protein
MFKIHKFHLDKFGSRHANANSVPLDQSRAGYGAQPPGVPDLLPDEHDGQV